MRKEPSSLAGPRGLNAEPRKPGKREKHPRYVPEGYWNEFVAFLRDSGARVTAARKIVFDNVMSRHDHFRADDLAAKLAAGPRRVSRGTVYRTLALLVKAEFVRAIRDGDVHFHYEHTYGHNRHEHLVCERCGAFIEFEAGEIARAIRDNCLERNFQERSYRLTVLGTCEKCRRRLEKKGKREGKSAGNGDA